MRFPLRLFTIVRLFCIVFILPTAAFGNKVDSLRGQLQKVEKDTARVRLYSKIAFLYQDINTDSAIGYAQAGLQLAGRVGDDRGQGDCLQQFGLAYMRQNKLAQAISSYQQAISHYGHCQWHYGHISAILSIADILFREGKYDSAQVAYKKGLEMAQRTGDMKHAGLAQISLGGLYADLGNYSEGLKYYLDATTTFEKSNDQEGLSMTLVNIATVYSSLGQYERALSYLKRSMALEQQPGGHKEALLYNLANTSEAYSQMGDYKNALYYGKRALALADTVGDIDWRLACMNNVADAHLNLGYYDEAFDEYSEVLRHTTSVSDPILIVAANTALGRILVYRGKLMEGLPYLCAAYQMASEKKMKESLFKAARELSVAYEKINKPAEALRYYKIYAAYQDSVFNEKSDKRVQQQQYEADLNKKQDQIQLLQKSEEVAHAEAGKQRLMVWMLASGVVLLIVIMVLLYRGRAQERHAKEMILKQKEEIQAQAQHLEELNAFKDKTFSVLSHDLRNPISAFTTTMLLLNENYMTPEQLGTLVPVLTGQINNLNTLLDSLLKWGSVYMQGQANTKPQKTLLHSIVQQNVSLLDYEAGKKQIIIDNNLSEGTTAFCDPGQLDIVVRNLLVNAIKFTGVNGHITVSARGKEDKIQLLIADNGIGMTPPQVQRLFTATPGSSTFGTDGEKGLGLGLFLCQEFITANGGTLTAESAPGSGTTFIISLPKA
jgi:signal transduction histidine kinase